MDPCYNGMSPADNDYAFTLEDPFTPGHMDSSGGTSPYEPVNYSNGYQAYNSMDASGVYPSPSEGSISPAMEMGQMSIGSTSKHGSMSSDVSSQSLFSTTSDIVGLPLGNEAFVHVPHVKVEDEVALTSALASPTDVSAQTADETMAADAANASDAATKPADEEAKDASEEKPAKPRRKRENRYKNAPASVIIRRRAQNRASQRAYRERKDQRIRDLESELETTRAELEKSRRFLSTVQNELVNIQYMNGGHHHDAAAAAAAAHHQQQAASGLLALPPPPVAHNNMAVGPVPVQEPHFDHGMPMDMHMMAPQQMHHPNMYMAPPTSQPPMMSAPYNMQ